MCSTIPLLPPALRGDKIYTQNNFLGLSRANLGAVLYISPSGLIPSVEHQPWKARWAPTSDQPEDQGVGWKHLGLPTPPALSGSAHYSCVDRREINQGSLLPPRPLRSSKKGLHVLSKANFSHPISPHVMNSTTHNQLCWQSRPFSFPPAE